MSAAYPHVALRAFITNAPDLFAGAGSQKLVGTLTQICRKLHEEGLPDRIDVPSKFTHVTLAQVLKDVQRQIALYQDRRGNEPLRDSYVRGSLTLTKLRYSLHLPATES